MPFHQCKHILIRNITASHILVNTLLLTLVKTMFGSQFDKAEKLLGETPDPLLVYGVEVSIQMYIAELSEPLRELYVVGYSLHIVFGFQKATYPVSKIRRLRETI